MLKAGMFQMPSPTDQDLINAINRVRFGLKPYDPNVNVAQDIGLGGPSTEYLATADDPYGAAFNYPTIWWDMMGNPQLLDGDQAYNQAIQYEVDSGVRFPRYESQGQAETFAQNRSLMGGGDVAPLGSILGVSGY